jgi:hypothetical protein
MIWGLADVAKGGLRVVGVYVLHLEEGMLSSY